MRLTPTLVTDSDAGLNCLGDRELNLRSLSIPVIENLALARNSYDTIDLSHNLVTELGAGFPPFPRLTTLYLAHNRVERIVSGLAASLPNLHTLVLTSNRIGTLSDLNLAEIAQLTALEVLSLLDNPITTSTTRLRDTLVAAIPSLKVFNYSKITADERASIVGGGAAALPSNSLTTLKKRQKRRRKARASTSSKFATDAATETATATATTVSSLVATKRKASSTVGNGGEGGGNGDGDVSRAAKKSRKLTAEESDAVRSYIENAASVEAVTGIQNALRTGTVIQFLASLKLDPVRAQAS